mmetsp:Transcript_37401/g.67266  ORF Transcript_37401/g.67266 Transcript_37401/m.67266 type:complete len:172 (+) Transcript_37401:871-1386(+)|eukprot:CAMPEP_0201891778 /NCGR_PEP_ID=MMETSP0902-20130614/35177_1 /ASSEMBLY_ACC=CAM_ASM_000551 /TAXON_ID=420261 /ORGANISM="Thalassiosira antarctica, Strain CCMP982" /LENGTH=171 /DNA_ID=CAMNT_0048423087 /DNA_START=660 /DNA_END=1175 /DNA_ORIENTATION=+
MERAEHEKAERRRVREEKKRKRGVEQQAKEERKRKREAAKQAREAAKQAREAEKQGRELSIADDTAPAIPDQLDGSTANADDNEPGQNERDVRAENDNGAAPDDDPPSNQPVGPGEHNAPRAENGQATARNAAEPFFMWAVQECGPVFQDSTKEEEASCQVHCLCPAVVAR